MSYYNQKTKTIDNEGILNDIIANFTSEKPKKTVWGNFRIENDELLYVTQTTKDAAGNADAIKNIVEGLRNGKYFLAENDVEFKDIQAKLDKGEYCRFKYGMKDHNTIARKIKVDGIQVVLGNSSILPLVGRTVAYGNESLNRSETLIQRKLAVKATMVPFSVFEQAKLDLNKYRVIERGPEEKAKKTEQIYNYKEGKKENKVTEVHFTGASLFEVEGQQFLFDIDRREQQHGIFNPFLVKLPRKVKTIAEAYQSLKPKAVVDAEKKGLKVLRQGEWFFIPSKGPKQTKLTERQKLTAMAATVGRWATRATRATRDLKQAFGAKFVNNVVKMGKEISESLPRALSLQAGQNRPNTVQTGLKQGDTTYVTGKVSHSGREHADLILKGWYVAVPNTSTKSFTITGDID